MDKKRGQKRKNNDHNKNNKIVYENNLAFQQYLVSYLALPSYKKVLSSMINFSEMYEPVIRFGKYYDFLDFNREENEYRRLKRSEIFLCQRDLIKTSDPRSGPKIIVTSRGHRVFFEEYPLAKLRKEKWDGYWTIVMFDFPEKKRDWRIAFRKKITSLGFGSPQISILASPLAVENDIQRYIEGEKINQFVWVLRAKRILGMENTEVACSAWPIEQINRLYKELLERLPAVKRLGNKSETERWRYYFLAVNHADPFLPYELLPDDWASDKCSKEFIKLGRFGFLRALLKNIIH